MFCFHILVQLGRVTDIEQDDIEDILDAMMFVWLQ